MSKTTTLLKDLRKRKLDVSLLSEETSPCIVNEWISTGCIPLDKIMGGGLPVGRITEVYGDQATGKSLLAGQVAAIAQQQGHLVAYADSETAVSTDMMNAVGVDPDNLLYAAPDTVQEVFDFFYNCIESKHEHYPDDLLVLIWDSVAATSIDREMDAEFGKSMMGAHAAVISQAMRKIARVLASERICALFLNQTREKIGVMFGDSTTTFGGKAIGFHSSVRVHLKLSSKLRSAKKKIIGVETRAIVTKNRMAPPFQEAILPIYFGSGVDDAGSTLHYLVDNELVERKGQYTTIVLGGQEVKFKKSQWRGIFDKHYDEIADIVFGDVDNSNEGESEEL